MRRRRKKRRVLRRRKRRRRSKVQKVFHLTKVVKKGKERGRQGETQPLHPAKVGAEVTVWGRTPSCPRQSRAT